MVLFLIMACAGDGPDTAYDCSSAPDVTWDGWGRGFFITYCGACHSETSTNRNGAPTNQVFDTWAEVLEREEDIRRTVLIEGSMPVGGGVYDEDLYQLEVLLSCSP